jgi:hypothetical protein
MPSCLACASQVQLEGDPPGPTTSQVTTPTRRRCRRRRLLNTRPEIPPYISLSVLQRVDTLALLLPSLSLFIYALAARSTAFCL